MEAEVALRYSLEVDMVVLVLSAIEKAVLFELLEGYSGVSATRRGGDPCYDSIHVTLFMFVQDSARAGHFLGDKQAKNKEEIKEARFIFQDASLQECGSEN